MVGTRIGAIEAPSIHVIRARDPLALLAFLTPVVALLLPLGRFGGLVWLVLAALLLLLRRRPSRVTGRQPAGGTPTGW